MKKLLASLRTMLLLPLLALGVAPASAQTSLEPVPALADIKSQEELAKAVAVLDAALFDSYNRCDLAKFASFFAEDVEFYHDHGGVWIWRGALKGRGKEQCY